MKLILKNSRIIMQSFKKTIVESVYNNKNGGVAYPGNFQTSGFIQCWIYPLEKGATYELKYTGSVNKNIGSVYLCSLCKLSGDYETIPQEGVGEKIFAWDNENSISQGGRFTVPEDTDKDCIVVSGLKENYDSDITVTLIKFG